MVRGNNPLANVEVFSERQDSYTDPTDSTKITRYGDIEDYGITDFDGRIKLLISPRFDYLIHMRDISGDLTYIKAPKAGLKSYTLDWSNAKPTSRNSQVCCSLNNVFPIKGGDNQICPIK